MRKSILTCLIALPATALLLAPLAQRAESQVVISSACNSIDRELLVNYDTTGGTLTGPLNINLQVYSNGEVKYSRSSGLSPTLVVEHVYIAPDQAQKFQRILRDAGAFTLCDQNISVADIPLSTLTVLTGQQNGKYHNFSYYIGFGQGYSKVSQAINNFIATHIPNT